MVPRPLHDGGRRLRGSPIPLQAGIKAHPLREENARSRHMQGLSEGYGALQFRRAGLACILPPRRPGFPLARVPVLCEVFLVYGTGAS
jgi:hypothetical protein